MKYYESKAIKLDDKRYYFDENGALENNGWFSISGVNGSGQEYTYWYYAETDGDVIRGGFRGFISIRRVAE